MKKTNK